MEPMATIDVDPRACDGALVRAFGFLGKRWNGVLLATLMNGAATYSEIKRSVAGIGDSTLSDRLVELAQAGLVTRSVDAGPPVSVTYRLTDAGLALLPSLTALGDWARQNLPTDGSC